MVCFPGVEKLSDSNQNGNTGPGIAENKTTGRTKFCGLLLTRVFLCLHCDFCGANVGMRDHSIRILDNISYSVNEYFCLNCHRPIESLYRKLLGGEEKEAKKIINELGCVGGGAV